MLAWLACGVAVAAPDAAHHLAQARLFVRKGWTDDAWREIQAALAAPGGARDPEVHALASTLAWARRDAATSALHAHRVATLSPDPQAAAAARAWAERIDRRFGTLELAAPHEGVAAALSLAGGPSMLGPDDAAYVRDLTAQLARRARRPRVVSRPSGDGTVDGAGVPVPAGGRARLTVDAGRGWQVLRLDIAAGLVDGLGSAAAYWSPSPTTEVGLSVPVGAWRLGALLELMRVGFRDTRDTTDHALGTAAGLRVGRDVETPTPLILTPSLSLRGGRFPGLACDAGPSCTGWGAAPGAGLVVGYRERGRTTALDSGVGVAIDAAVGTADGAGFLLPRTHLLAHLSFSL